MPRHRTPNTQVWLQGREYVEAAEILLDYNRLPPAAVLSALAIEIFLKSFLAKRDAKGKSTTEQGHGLIALFDKFRAEDALNLVSCMAQVNGDADIRKSLRKYDGTFTKYRYRYEPNALYSVGSDIIYFARDLCEATFLLGKQRGV